jgi:hypothetical protein
VCCCGETVTHLLIHCDIAFGWSRALGVFGIQCSDGGIDWVSIHLTFGT